MKKLGVTEDINEGKITEESVGIIANWLKNNFDYIKNEEKAYILSNLIKLAEAKQDKSNLGSFLLAVRNNNFVEAASRISNSEITSLKAYAKFMFAFYPMSSIPNYS